jgi:hypothetical protein
VEETGVTQRKLQTDKHYHIMFIKYTSPLTGFELPLVVIGTDCINKTDRYDITEILLKVALNTINPMILKPMFPEIEK